MSLRSSTTDKALARLDAKKKTAQQKKISKVMREFKAGELNSGSKDGPIVKTRKQAIAIALSEAGAKRKDAAGSPSTATIAKALAHADSFTLKRKYDVVVNLADWEMVTLQFAKPPEGQLKDDLGAMLKDTYNYNPLDEQTPPGMPKPSYLSVYISKLYDIEEAAETIAAELERQGLKVLRRDDRAMPRSTVVTFAKLDSLEDREDGKKVLRKVGGKRPGKKCGNSYVSADKNCKGHSSKTESGKRKLTALGKQSAEELAAKIRERKGMAALKKGEAKPKATKSTNSGKKLAKTNNPKKVPTPFSLNVSFVRDRLGQSTFPGKAEFALDTVKRLNEVDSSAMQLFKQALENDEFRQSGIIDRIASMTELALRKTKPGKGDVSQISDAIGMSYSSNSSPDDAQKLLRIAIDRSYGKLSEAQKNTLARKSQVSVIARTPEKEYDSETVKDLRSRHSTFQQLLRKRNENRSLFDSVSREDGKKVLRKVSGKRPGKKCKGSYISADKKCSSDYGLTPSGKRKLTDMGKKSAVELANKVRQQRGLTAVTREGSGQPLPFDRKSRQSASIAKATMSVKDRREKLRREFDPNSSGKRAEAIAKKEEKRAIVGLGGTQKAMEEADAVPPEKPKLTVVKGGKAVPTSTKGAKFLQAESTPNWLKKHEGMIEIARAIDFDGGVIDTGSHDATKSGSWKSGTIRMGRIKVLRLNPPSKANKYGSATAEVDYGEGYGVQKVNLELANLAGGVKQTLQENSKLSAPKPAQKASQDKALEKMSMGELFQEADRVGSKYQSPNDPIDLTARRQAAEILRETGVTKAIDRATGKRRLTTIEGGGRTTPKSPLGNLGAKLLTSMTETDKALGKLVEQKTAIEKKYAKSPSQEVDDRLANANPQFPKKRNPSGTTAPPKTTQMAQLQALREAKIKSGTFKRSVDSIDRSFG